MFMSTLGVSYRMSISFAIVCMVNHTAVHDLKTGSSSDLNSTVTPYFDSSNDTTDSDSGILACETQHIKDTSSLEVSIILFLFLSCHWSVKWCRCFSTTIFNKSLFSLVFCSTEWTLRLEQSCVGSYPGCLLLWISAVTNSKWLPGRKARLFLICTVYSFPLHFIFVYLCVLKKGQPPPRQHHLFRLSPLVG